MSVLDDMRTYLLTQTAVTDLIGTRIYFDALQQSTSMPAVVFELTGGEVMDRHLSATGSTYRSQVHVYCYASSRTGATALADAVYDALEFASGTWTDTTVHRAFVEQYHDLTEEPRDGSGAWRYIRVLFTAVWH